MSRSRSGFTLIELLLTLGVLAIGLTSIFALLPGLSEYSRTLRDRDRMRTFADAVFASLEVHLSREEAEEAGFTEEWLIFQTQLGRQPLSLGPGEHSWPDTNGVEDWVPVFRYRLELRTNSVTEIEAVLNIRPDHQLDTEEFRRILYPEVPAW